MQIRNKPSEEITSSAFIFGSVSMVENKYSYSALLTVAALHCNVALLADTSLHGIIVLL
jgi:hypothetical protein